MTTEVENFLESSTALWGILGKAQQRADSGTGLNKSPLAHAPKDFFSSSLKTKKNKISQFLQKNSDLMKKRKEVGELQEPKLVFFVFLEGEV